jgi:hypothetical protein
MQTKERYDGKGYQMIQIKIYNNKKLLLHNIQVNIKQEYVAVKLGNEKFIVSWVSQRSR